MQQSSRGSKGLELTELGWLLDHHKTKEAERRQMVEDLHLCPGEKVLDLGCGPGLWTSMLAEKVADHGQVVGLDFDPGLIAYAQQNFDHDPHQALIKFTEGDFYEIPFEDDYFDLVFFGNCFAYVTDTHRVLQEQRRVTKAGGKIAIKDFDGAIIIFHPIDSYLSAKVLAATARGLKERPPNRHFDNYVGRELHGALLGEGFKDVSTKTYAIQKVAPLSPEAKRYILGNAEWYMKTGAPYLSEEDIHQWQSHFDSSSESYILDREDFYFCMLEVLAVGTV